MRLFECIIPCNGIGIDRGNPVRTAEAVEKGEILTLESEHTDTFTGAKGYRFYEKKYFKHPVSGKYGANPAGHFVEVTECAEVKIQELLTDKV